jgi:hypothetical protein
MTAGLCDWCWTACAAAAALAIALAPVSGHAQPDPQTDRAAPRVPGQAQQNASKKNVTAERPPESASEQAKPWSLDDALPSNSPAAQSQKPKPAPAAKRTSKSDAEKPGLGRLPLSSGPASFGIETETKVKTTAFPDGRPAPGVESTQPRPPSYFGLSISVPTTEK